MAKSVVMCLHPARVFSLENDAAYVIQKNPPRIKPPFKVYVYMSSGGYAWQKDGWSTAITSGENTYNGTHKVVGEFFCSEVKQFLNEFTLNRDERIREYAFLASMRTSELAEYLEKHFGYAWKVDHLRLYDKPKTIADLGLENAPSTWTYIKEPDTRGNLYEQVFAAYCSAAAASCAHTNVVSAKNLAELMDEPVYAVRNACRKLADEGLIERAYDKWYNSQSECMCYANGYRLSEKGRNTDEFLRAEKAEEELLRKKAEGETDVSNTFWVSFINDQGEKPHLVSINEAYLDLDDARKQVNKIRENEDVIAAWVDEFTPDNKRVGTPIMECYINCFGTRDMLPFKRSGE